MHSYAKGDWKIPVLKTVATNHTGIDKLWQSVEQHHQLNTVSEKSAQLLTEKAYQLILMNRMKTISKEQLFNKIHQDSNKNGFNLYQFLQDNYFN